MATETEVNASDAPDAPEPPHPAHESQADVTIRSSSMIKNTNDPFDPKSLRLGQDFAQTAGVKKLRAMVESW